MAPHPCGTDWGTHRMRANDIDKDALTAGMKGVTETIEPVLEFVRTAGGRPLLVGGAVRDAILGLSPKDADVEVYGLAVGPLAEALEQVGRVHLVGQSFGVLKVDLPDGPEIDVRSTHNSCRSRRAAGCVGLRSACLRHRRLHVRSVGERAATPPRWPP